MSASDCLFRHCERLQAGRPWGRVLDAGTGRNSLSWIAGLEPAEWTAVTATEDRAQRLRREFCKSSRPRDRVVVGNWTDPSLLHGEVFDVVLADYLIGAVDRFAPYFQYRCLERLKPHVGERLYVIGLEPYPEHAPTAAGRLILDVARLRDACILHAGHRCHREYPLEWMLNALDRSGYDVIDAEVFPIIYRLRFVEEQLDVCRRKLPHLSDRSLARGLEHRVRSLAKAAQASVELQAGVQLGSDYVVTARPRTTAGSAELVRPDAV